MVAFYGLIGAFVVPPLARHAIVDRAGSRLGRVVAMEDIFFNPFTLAATVKGFRILEADRRTTFLRFDQLDIDGSITSLYHLAPVIDEVALSGLSVSLVRDSESHYNVTDIIGRLAAGPAGTAGEKGKSDFSVSNIRVKGARIDFEDRPKGARHQVTEIDVAIPFISNLPSHRKEYVQPSFSAKVNGTALRLTGESLPFENSLRTHVALDLDSLDVQRYVEYSPVPLPIKVDSGKLDAHLSVRFLQAAGKQPSIDVTGTLGLRDLRLSAPEAQSLARLARADATLAAFDPLGGRLHVSSVRVAEASLGDEIRLPATEAKDLRVDFGARRVRLEVLSSNDGVVGLHRDRSGAIDSPLLKVRGQAASPGGAEAWTVEIGKVALANCRVAVADESVKPQTTHRALIEHLEANELSSAKGAKSTLSARLTTGKGGSVALESDLAFDPLAVDARIDARHVDLLPYRPYARYFSTVALKSGFASARGSLAVHGEGDAMRIAYSGGASVVKLATFDTANREDLLNWDSVKLAGVAFDWSPSAPMNLSVAEVAVDKAYSRIVVTPEGKINLQQLKFATPSDPTAAQAPTDAPKPRNVRIDRITFGDSRLDFSDHFIQPNYTADVGNLHGSVTNLSSDPASRGRVDLEGSYDQVSPVVIGGTINALRGDLYVDIAAQGKDIELPKLTAYSQRYAGYGITRGKLTLDVKYHLENGTLQGRNKIFLDQLTFGEHVESPEATKLPVLFAVNLLKDSKGQINLELPITGSLEDPQFEVGALITQVVTNLLKKAVTSPFSLLTAAFGGSGNGGKEGAGAEDLAFVEFDPGRDDLGDGARKKLDALAKALLDRPAVALQLAARVDAERDARALKLALLRAKVGAAKREALSSGGKGAPNVEETPLDAGEYPRYLKAAYQKEFPPKKDAPPATDLSVEEMEASLMERLPLAEDALRVLAQRRAERVKGYLVARGQLPSERLLFASAGIASEEVRAMRVDFSLK